MSHTDLQKLISDLLDTYIASFNAGDYAKAASYYSEPSVGIAAGSPVTVMGTHKDRVDVLESTVARLREDGFEHSEWGGPKTIIVLDPEGLVLASCACKRLRRDGTSVEEFTATYTLRKEGSGWKIVAIHHHPFETQLKPSNASQ